MYTKFWGFRQKPFQQVPNPDFLFLSATHEEALAHLTYALAEGEGFVMITGEIGTGKSTLCRSFFQKLDANTACAYIFNSKLDPLQLLKSINAEFGIPAEADRPQELIDVLNAFLIEKKAAGHKVMIVIDEAQNLPVESLEQVRLLSNLETTREKLLHLVLVGQPELAEMIDSFALRQLGQRIQLACHLHPLSFEETVQYIQHRINLVAEKPQMPFDKRALKAIYGFSQGVPRLINTACDRMLLAAYLKKRSRISAGLASQVVNELLHRGRPPAAKVSWARIAVAVSLVLMVASAAWIFLLDGPIPYLSAKVTEQQAMSPPSIARQPLPEKRHEIVVAIRPETMPTTPGPVPDTKAIAEADRASPILRPLDEWLASIHSHDTRSAALEAVLHQWDVDAQVGMVRPGENDAAFFERVAERHGLSMMTIEDAIDTLVVLDLPAVVPLERPGNQSPVYLGVVGVQDDGHFYLTISGQEAIGHTDAWTLMRRWGGKAFVPWKNYMGYEGVIPASAPLPAVVSLKQLLWEIGYKDLVIDEGYDDVTRRAVREIQAQYGLKVDGLVGDRTKIVLFNEKRSLPIPHLSQWPAAGSTVD